jgi:hypothetical protein
MAHGFNLMVLDLAVWGTVATSEAASAGVSLSRGHDR